MTISTLAVLLLVVVLLGAAGATRRLRWGHWAATATFAVYLVGVANFVILPLTFDPRAAEAAGPIDLGRLVELRPFFLSGVDAMPLSQAFLNILLTVPFGFGLPFVVRLRPRALVGVGVLFSVGIEAAQLGADALHLALPTWSIDVNDVILNTTGVIVGYVVFRLCGLLYAHSAGRLPVRRGAWAHFHDVLVGNAFPGT
jgi:glycopeptide antibiotics resistance protein